MMMIDDDKELLLMLGFLQERDKLLLPRLVVYELVQALKFKTSIPDTNLILLVQLVLQVCVSLSS